MMEKLDLSYVMTCVTDRCHGGEELAHRCSGQNRHLDVKDDNSRCEGRSELDQVGLGA